MEKWRPPDWDKRVEARIKEVNSKNPIVVSIKDNMEAGADALLQYLLDCGIVSILRLEALNKNGANKRRSK